MNRFEDRLWNELVSAHGARLAAQPARVEPYRRAWPVATGGAVGLAAAAAALVLAIAGGTSPPPAYAVTDNHNGTVTLTIRELSHRAAVNRMLARLGVRARVVPLRENCAAALNMAVRYLQPTTQPWSQFPSVRGPVGSWTVTILPSRIPVGHTLVFAPRQRTSGWEMADAIVAGAGPNCSSPEYLVGLGRAPTTP